MRIYTSIFCVLTEVETQVHIISGTDVYQHWLSVLRLCNNMCVYLLDAKDFNFSLAILHENVE